MSRDALPINAIDTCVFIGAILPTPSETRQVCDRYIRRIGETFRLSMTAPLAFEALALAKLNPKLGEDLLDFLIRLLRYPENIVAHPRPSAFTCISALLAKDPRLDPLDAFHAAAAIDAKIPVFVTLDKDLLHSEVLKREGLLVLHPRELLGRQPRWPGGAGEHYG